MSRRRTVDLHVHTDCSDGKLTPYEIIDLAAAHGVKTIAITDHDTTAAFTPALYSYANERGVKLVSGIEFSSRFDSRPVHILGLFIDTENEALQRKISELGIARAHRCERMVELLGKCGFELSAKDIIENAGASVGRPHIARELLNRGYVESISEAFEKYIGVGCSCYVEKQGIGIKQAISLIRSCGGISFLAHPKLIENDFVVYYVVSCGIDGIEVYYNSHSKADEARYARIASDNHLLMSGGSDYHGQYASESLGSCGLTDAAYDEILKRLYAVRGVKKAANYPDLRTKNDN